MDEQVYMRSKGIVNIRHDKILISKYVFKITKLAV